MTCDSSSLSAGTRWVWIILQKKGSAPLVWPNPMTVHRSPSSPHVLHLALSPSCWFSSICLLWPSPEEASIKSPLETTTGLDSYKLEQNNLFFPGTTPTPAPHPRACPYLSHIVSGRSCERCCEAESTSCLLMHTVLMWAVSIRQHFWLPHTPLPFHCQPFISYVFTCLYICSDKAKWSHSCAMI